MHTWEQLSHQNRAELERIQHSQLQEFSRHYLPFSPFYRSLFQKLHLDFKKIRTINDLRQLPFTTKLDLLPTPKLPKKTQDFILQPDKKLITRYWSTAKVVKMGLSQMIGLDIMDKLQHEFNPVHITFTTGRSANQIPYLYTTRDIETLEAIGYRIFEIIGASKNDIVINGFPFAPHLAFWLGYSAPRAVKILSLQTGGGRILGSDKIMDAIEQLGATLLIFMPGYFYHLMRQAVEQKRDFSSVKFVAFGGERVSPGLRDKVRELLAQTGAKNVKIVSSYALTEAKTAWVQCHEDSGYHLYPDLEHIELVDEDGKPVPEGQPGEIVYTALDWRGSVVMRYKTGDICQGMYWSKPCEYCGRTTPRLHWDIQRKSEMMELHLSKVKGEIVNLNMFYSIMHNLKGIDEWQVEIKKKDNDPFELDELWINLSVHPGVDEKAVSRELTKLIDIHGNIRPIIKFYSREEMIEMLALDSELKEHRLVDHRKKK